MGWLDPDHIDLVGQLIQIGWSELAHLIHELPKLSSSQLAVGYTV